MGEAPILYWLAIIIATYFLSYRIGRIANRRARICAITGAFLLPVIAAVIFYLVITWGQWSDPNCGFWCGLMLLFLMAGIPIFMIWVLMAVGYWAGRKL